MIPKIIHYCWFGNNPKSKLINDCINSWKKYLYEYEIIEWNENNFDVNICKYVSDAYELKKWAHVSDYVRAFALYNYGGIYLDTDVEITSFMDEFLVHKAFSGFESKGFPFTALWGTEKEHHWPKKIIDMYHSKTFSLETNTISISKILIEDYQFDPNLDEIQNFQNDIFIYPSNYFCVNIRNYAIHHFDGSWLENNYNYKGHVSREFFNNNFIDKNGKFYNSLLILQNKYEISNTKLLYVILSKIFKSIFKINGK